MSSSNTAGAGGQYDRLPALAMDLVSHQVTVISAGSPPAARAAKVATSTIPIVFTSGGDAASPFALAARKDGLGTMRAIGLVLLSIAIMALLLTDADAKRRSSAQGSQAAGGSEAGARATLGTAARTPAIRRSLH